MKIIDKSFKYWEVTDLQKYLGLTRDKKNALLTTWLTTPIEITEAEHSQLQELANLAETFIDYWNEQELIVKFIVELTRLIKFDSYQDQVASFAERKLAITIQNEVVQAKLSGTVDWLVATGIHKPEHPFFFIHEYKAAEGQILDGRGQLLAAMLVAQELNKQPPEPTLFAPNPVHFYKDMPIYGAYIVGRAWYFLVLKDRKYDISRLFSCTEMEDLQAIFKILKAQKQIIYSYLETGKKNES